MYARDPDPLAVDDVSVDSVDCSGLYFGCIGISNRLRHAHGLESPFAASYARQSHAAGGCSCCSSALGKRLKVHALLSQ